jgi:hypothetical protein
MWQQSPGCAHRIEQIQDLCSFPHRAHPRGKYCSTLIKTRRFVSSSKGPTLSVSHRPDLQVSTSSVATSRDAQHLYLSGSCQIQDSDRVEFCSPGIVSLLVSNQAMRHRRISSKHSNLPCFQRICARPGCSIFARKMSNRVGGVNWNLDKGPKRTVAFKLIAKQVPTH